MNTYYIIAFPFAILALINFNSDTSSYLMYFSVAVLFFILGMDEKKKKKNDKN